MPLLDVGVVQVCCSATCCSRIIALGFLVCFGGGEINLLSPQRLLLLCFFFLRDLLNYLEGLIINIYRNNVPILPLLQFSQLTIRFFGNLSFSLNYIEINKQLKTVLR